MTINILPNELLLQIFAKNFRYPKNKENKRCHRPQLQASLRVARQVCRRWWHLIVGTHSPSFWISHLSLFLELKYHGSGFSYASFIDEQARFLEGLEAARESCMVVRLQATTAYSNQLASANSLVGQEDAIELFVQALHALLRYQRNVISIDAEIGADELFEPLDRTLALFRAPNLLSELTHRRDWNHRGPFDSERYPTYINLNALETLHLGSHPIPLAGICTLPKNLSSLTVAIDLSTDKCTDTNEFQTLFLSLARCATLKALDLRLCSGIHLSTVSSSEGVAALALPSLSRLKLQGHPSDLVLFVDLLETPHLNSLSLVTEGSRPVPDDFKLHPTSSGKAMPHAIETITSFEFGCTHSGEWHILDWVDSFFKFPNASTMSFFMHYPQSGPTIPIIPEFFKQHRPSRLSLRNMEFTTIKYLLQSLNLTRLERLHMEVEDDSGMHQCYSVPSTNVIKFPTPLLREMKLEKCCFYRLFPVLARSLDLSSLESLEIRTDPSATYHGQPNAYILLQPVSASLTSISRLIVPITLLRPNYYEPEEPSAAPRRLLRLFPNIKELSILYTGGEEEYVDWIEALHTGTDEPNEEYVVMPVMEKLVLRWIHGLPDKQTRMMLLRLKSLFNNAMLCRRLTGYTAWRSVELSYFYEGTDEVQYRETL